MDLPYVHFNWLRADPSVPSFPTFERDEMVGFLDAAHATELKTRRSVTGFVLLLCYAAIAWKSRVQPVVATSSTEAEFYATVTCAKAAKYLQYVLQELNALHPGATPLFIDNQAAIAMVNESRPTPRARHIQIQAFAIQEWRQAGDVILCHCPGILNPSDDLTKALGWVLHSRHARRSMGHYEIGSPSDLLPPTRPHVRVGTQQAGEGVGTNVRDHTSDWEESQETGSGHGYSDEPLMTSTVIE